MKKISINKKDGRILAGLLTLPVNPQYLLIICHGFLGAKENRGKIFPFAGKLKEKGLGVLAFDFTGAGESSGQFASVTVSRQVNDLETVISYAEAEYKLPIILLGRSFGGSTIIGLPQSPDSVAGYILWSTPIDLVKTFSTILAAQYVQLEAGIPVTITEMDNVYELKPDLVADFKNINLKQSLKALEFKPVLICHGLADEVVDYQNAVYMHEKLPKSTLRLIAGADHSFTDFTHLREEITLEWLETNFSKLRRPDAYA